jgi:hypothetical protein
LPDRYQLKIAAASRRIKPNFHGIEIWCQAGAGIGRGDEGSVPSASLDEGNAG